MSYSGHRPAHPHDLLRPDAVGARPTVMSGYRVGSCALLLLPGLLTVLAGCRAAKEEWVGLYYENVGSMSGVAITAARLADAPKFSTLQACTTWGNGGIATKNFAGYQCALGCKPIGSTTVPVDDTVCKDSTAIIRHVHDGS
jgi:hypothetical protein